VKGAKGMLEETPECFAGSERRRLRGVLHWPADRAGAEACVICPPFGEERKSAARVMTLAARVLCRCGFFVFRFDYEGTGESDGWMEQATVDHWVADIRRACEHVSLRAGVRSVGILGIRFGGTLAALLPAENTPWPFMILWGPLLSGAACIDHALRHRAATRLVVARGRTDPVSSGESDTLDPDMGGFCLTDRLRRQLEEIELPSWARASAHRVVLVHLSSRRRVPDAYRRLAEKLVAPSGRARCLSYPVRPFWVTASRYDPTDLVRQSLDTLGVEYLNPVQAGGVGWR